MTKREFLACVAVLEAGAGKPIGEQQADVWFELFEDMPAGVFRDAVKRCLLENEFPGLPAIGKVRRYCGSERLHGVPESAETVFGRVRAAVRRYGWDESPLAAESLGPEIWHVVECVGGWDRFCDCSPDQRATLFAQFRDAWRGTAERAAMFARLPAELRPAIVHEVAARLAIGKAMP